MDFWVHVYELGTHPWLEDISWVAQTVLVVIALVGAWLAYAQLSQIRASAQQEVRIANATLLMDLDKRWDTDLDGSRKIFSQAREEIAKTIGQEHPLAREGDREAYVKSAWTAKLNDMRNNQKDDYRKLMAIMGFFETVGLMVKMNYIDQVPILELFGGTLEGVGKYFEEHIANREKEAGVPVGLLEHARKLCKDASSYLANR